MRPRAPWNKKCQLERTSEKGSSLSLTGDAWSSWGVVPKWQQRPEWGFNFCMERQGICFGQVWEEFNKPPPTDQWFSHKEKMSSFAPVLFLRLAFFMVAGVAKPPPALSDPQAHESSPNRPSCATKEQASAHHLPDADSHLAFKFLHVCARCRFQCCLRSCKAYFPRARCPWERG